jgi:hypothetical protein
LPAMAVGQLASLLTDTPPSQASQLPHLIFIVLQSRIWRLHSLTTSRGALL